MSYDRWTMFCSDLGDLILICPDCGEYVTMESDRVTAQLAVIDAHACRGTR